MKKLLILLLCVIQYSCVNNQQLKLIKSYPVMTHNNLEPSGLTKWGDEFFTVSDNHNTIFRLEILSDKIQLVPYIEILQDDANGLDFEGITHDDEFFYLVSEKLYQILKVSKDGQYQEWISENDDLKIACKQAGLCQVKNANIEGICVMNDGQLLLVAERQPRGFIEFEPEDNKFNAYPSNLAIFDYQQNRPPDFTGLSCSDEMYVLDRNAHRVAQLKKINNKFQESVGYSYQHVIEKSEFKYQDMAFGHAEGLVVDGNYVYIILDHNCDYHVQDPNNNDSLFLKLEI